MTRREVLGGAGVLAVSGRLHGQDRLPPVGDLVNPLEFEPIARQKLAPGVFAGISGGDRAPFDRITFRPHILQDSTKADYSTTLFGQQHYMPILVGPLAEQRRYHPDGEPATVRGAGAAKAAMIVSARSSVPIQEIAAQAKSPLWFQVDLEAGAASIPAALAAGCKVLCVTVNAGVNPSAGIDWKALDGLRKGHSLPVVLKGVMGPEEADRAVKAGVQGIVVSNYSAKAMEGVAAPISVLPAIADAVGSRAAVLVDGSFRRGSDVLKGLALGAKGVLLGRPVLWGLAAFGAEGVQAVIESIQAEFARDMVMCGRTSIGALDRSAVTVHRR